MPRPFRYWCPLCLRLRSEGIGLKEQGQTCCPECIKDESEIHQLYLEILRVKPQHSSLTPAQLFRKLWEAYNATSNQKKVA